MRWDNLFDDFENQLEAEIGIAERTVHEDEERQRQAHLTLHDRLRNLTLASQVALANESGEPDALDLTLVSGRELAVSIVCHGRDWCAVDVTSPTSLVGHAILPLAGIAALSPTAAQLILSLGSLSGNDDVLHAQTAHAQTSHAQAPRLADTIGLGFVLRDLARRRRTLEIHSLQGIFVGTLDRVGTDHCDLAEHAANEARREGNVRSYRVVALATIVLIRIL